MNRIFVATLPARVIPEILTHPKSIDALVVWLALDRIARTDASLQLPGRRELARITGINEHRTRHAIKELARIGLIEIDAPAKFRRP